jgi:hypothetical protein
LFGSHSNTVQGTLIERFLVTLLADRLPTVVVATHSLSLATVKIITMLLKTSMDSMKFIEINVATPLAALFANTS